MSKSVGFVILVIVTVITIGESEGKVIGTRDRSRYNRVSNVGLYDINDEVVLLNSTNLISTIEDGKTSWIVEFYLSWCGDCQRFAPIWKSFAKNIMGWKDVVKVAVINCAHEQNIPFCRDYDINWYPTIRYFSIGGGGIGVDAQKTYLEDGVRHGLIEKLQQDQQQGKGGNWPDMAPYRNSNPLAWMDTLAPSVLYHIFFFENSTSFMGTEVILDNHVLNTLQILRVTNDNDQLCLLYNVTKFPTMIAFDRHGSHNRLELPENTREGANRAINDFLRSKNLRPNPLAPTTSTPPSTNPTTSQNTPSPPTNSNVEDILYQADLEAALRISLQDEISRARNIEGHKLLALKGYLAVLSRYFPQTRRNTEFVSKLYYVLYNRTSITGRELASLIASEQKNIAPGFADTVEFIGCRSSRAYTCGLWTMFHTLTVHHAEAFGNEAPESRSVGAVLQAMHGYIENFFGCGNCRDHFLEMAERRELSRVQSVDEAILWLWRAHNEVNERLAKEDAGDPRFPKIQYPSTDKCPRCRGPQGWNEREVLGYLKKKYGASGIHHGGSE